MTGSLRSAHGPRDSWRSATRRRPGEPRSLGGCGRRAGQSGRHRPPLRRDCPCRGRRRAPLYTVTSPRARRCLGRSSTLPWTTGRRWSPTSCPVPGNSRNCFDAWVHEQQDRSHGVDLLARLPRPKRTCDGHAVASKQVCASRQPARPRRLGSCPRTSRRVTSGSSSRCSRPPSDRPNRLATGGGRSSSLAACSTRHETGSTPATRPGGPPPSRSIAGRMISLRVWPKRSSRAWCWLTIR